VDPENIDTFPGFRVAPVSMTSVERMLTFDGGRSVMARTTDEFPEFCVCEPISVPLRQPAMAVQKIRIVKMGRNRNMFSRQSLREAAP